MLNFVIIFLFIIIFSPDILAEFVDWKPCVKKSVGRDSFVCVCTGDHCDSPQPLGEFDDQTMLYYLSDKREHRLARFELRTQNDEPGNDVLHVRVNTSEKRQQILGFGGAFTDSAGINLKALGEDARRALLEAYFDPKIGIGYSIGRVPIASCDFSTREYSYLDTPDDFNLTTFALAKEDFDYKIPFILAANAMSGGKLLLFASPWSAPGWMKTSGHMKGPGQLKGPFNGKYYETYAHYFKRFFEAYKKQNITFWGLTIENEPAAGNLFFWQWQAMYMSSNMQRDFAADLLSPLLKQSSASRHLKIMAHDDQRSTVLNAAKDIYATPEGLKAIDGLGVHWYSHSAFDVLTETHAQQPNKFILATEACTGYMPFEHKVLLGDWSRGESYGHDILNDLRNWVVGWTDWNLCLDLEGGPNWVRNFVDAPIIVNASAGEFYKQPMFYFMAHFSRFVPRGSLVVSSSLFTADGTILVDRPMEKAQTNVFLNMNVTLSENSIEHVAFQTPEDNRVVVLMNSNRANSFNVSVGDLGDSRQWTIPVGPNSIVTAIWKVQKKQS